MNVRITPEMYPWIAVGVVVTLQLALVCLFLMRQRKVSRLHDRVAHLSDAITMLTDTVEGGLQEVAREVVRQATQPPSSPSRARAATKRRVAVAAKRGRSLRDIAAAEQISEGEVNLWLQLARAESKDVVSDAQVR